MQGIVYNVMHSTCIPQNNVSTLEWAWGIPFSLEVMFFFRMMIFLNDDLMMAAHTHKRKKKKKV